MSLNIKDDETHQLAKKLASLTGESMKTAVKIAVRERIDRQQSGSKLENRLDWLNDITKETARLMKDGRTSKELFDELYDPETGLPA